MENLILYQSPYPKQRIGRPHDGGYVIANLPDGYDQFLSGGIAGDISFEEHFLSLYPVPCHAFDGTVNSFPSTKAPITFVKKNLGNTNTETTTDLHEYMTGSNIFMKMDIEGHEFRVMPTIIEAGLITKIKQLVIEIHSPGDIQAHPAYFAGLSDITNPVMFQLLANINKTHTLVHFHANNGPQIQKIDGISLPHVFELTYIRNDYVMTKVRNTEPLPTSIDQKNIVNKPDYQLSGFPYT
jgi:hypothetical protein